MTEGVAALLVLVATVTGVDGASIQIDAGLIDGLRAGDRGVAYYELTVGTTTRRVDVGPVRVQEVEEHSSTLEGRTERPVGAGFRVRFELPGDRARPAEIVRLARERLEAGRFDDVAERMLDALVPSDPEIERRFIELLEQRGLERESGVAQSEPAAAQPEPPALPVRVVMPVPAGVYQIGVPERQAKYFNQQPRFDVELRAFLIDRDLVRQKAFSRAFPDHEFASSAPEALALGLTYDQARAFCESEGGRLPTEFEWQAALERGGVAVEAGTLEWTASWYKAYPGNTRREREYGETFRVLRGASAYNDPERHLRRYLDPAKGNSRVGFRCLFPEERQAG